jgi:thymidine kinase
MEAIYEYNESMCTDKPSRYSETGYLEIILGPMFSGKTTSLIQAYKKYTFIGKSVAVLNWAGDQRYHETMLSTHDKTMIPCIMTDQLKGVWEKNKDKDVILINEGQFFSDLYEVVLEMVEIYGKTVYICGLDGDFLQNKFGRILDLIPRCDQVTKLHALCSKCRDGRPAIFSHRLTRESTQIVIGSDNYVPLCRACLTRNRL